MHKKCVIHKTTNYQILESESGAVFSNRGTVELVTFTLPDNAAKGVFFNFVNEDRPNRLTVFPSPLDTLIANTGFVMGEGVWADSNGETVGFVSDGNRKWLSITKSGTWTAI